MKNAVDRTELVIKSLDMLRLDFKIGGKEVTYDELLQVPFDKEEIAPGIIVWRNGLETEEGFWLFCTMESKTGASTLLGHYHNFDEVFHVDEGAVFCKITNVIINAGESYSFNAGSWHYPVGIGDIVRLRLFCKKPIQ